MLSNQKGTTIIPILIIILILGTAAYFVLNSYQPKNESPIQSSVQLTATPANVPSPIRKDAEDISLEEIKSLVPEIVWEETTYETKELYEEVGLSQTEVEISSIKGTKLFTSQTNISLGDYFEVLDNELENKGWYQSSGGDSPLGSYWGYTAKVGNKRKYIEFQYQNGCKAAGLSCVDGNSIFLSDAI